MALYTATIANGASLSGGVKLEQGSLARIDMPSAWDAAPMTFQVSVDGEVSYQDYVDETGAEITVTPAANKTTRVQPLDFDGVTHLKVRSGTSAAPVNQTGARAIVLATVER